MNSLYKRIRNLNLPIDLQIKLFDHTIAPFLLCGCEIWGYQNSQIIENVHNDFLRNILKLRKSTPLYILYAELGRRSLQINIKNRMIGFCISIINGKNSKLTNLLYNTLYNENEIGNYNFKWIKCIKDTLISFGKIGLFCADSLQNAQALKLSIKQTFLFSRFIHTRLVFKVKQFAKKAKITQYSKQIFVWKSTFFICQGKVIYLYVNFGPLTTNSPSR